QNKNGRPIGRPFLFQLRCRSRVIAVAIVAVEAVAIVIHVVIVVIRGLIKESLSRTGIVIVVVGAPARRTDVVDPGVARQIAAGLVAPRPAVFDAAAAARRVTARLVAAAAA